MEIKTEVLPGDLSDSRLVQVDRRCEVWLRGVNGQTGYVLLITCPSLLNLRKKNMFISIVQCVSHSRETLFITM